MTTYTSPRAYATALDARTVTRGRSLLRALVETPADPAAAVARLALGIMILPHGLQKMFGVFGGHGYDGTMAYFTEVLGIPWAFALLAIAAEFLGGLGLVSGLLGRVAAFGVGVDMATAALMNHVGNGFFMNWEGQLAAGQEGFEFFVLAVALAAVVVIRGSGSWSIDRLYDRD